LWAAVETPDTPRIFGRLPYHEALQRLVMSAFLPNSYFVVNAGLELLEKQPMNLGLDATFDDKWVLPRDDEFYGKLSFFDHYALHWDSEKDLTYIIGKLNRLRVTHYDAMAKICSNEPLMVKHKGAMFGMEQHRKTHKLYGSALTVCGNRSFGYTSNRRSCTIQT